MKKQILIPMLIVGFLFTTLVATSVFAYQGDYTKKGPNYTPERETIIQNAFNTNNYEVWKAEMEKTNSGKRVLSVINKDNFSKFAEANKLAQQGKIAEANKIRTELGLRTSTGGKLGIGRQNNGQGRYGNGNCLYNQKSN